MNSLFRIIQDNPNNQTNSTKFTNKSINPTNQTNSTKLSKSLNPFVINKDNKDNKTTNEKKSNINNLESNIKSSNIETNKKISDIKYWEYGNSGLKVRDFNKIMSKNLSILYYVDKTFEQLFSNEKITIKKLFNKNFSNIFSIGSSKINSSNGNISVELDHNKISGSYKLVASGISTISNIKILPEELTKLKVPELSDVLNNLDNIKFIIKITNILNLFNNFDIKNDNSDPAFNLYDIISNSLAIISNYKNNDKEKNLLKSNSSNAFYIKMYDTHSKAFIIDGIKKIIYYICETDFDDKIIFKYYVFNLNDNWKII